MTSPVAPSVVQAFYLAYVSRDPARIAPFLADDAEWLIAGPVDIFPFCGYRRGKDAVMALFKHDIPQILDIRGFEPQELLIDGDQAATLNRISGIQSGTGRIISYRCAQFLRFKDSKVVSFRSIIDSFDAAEQIVGHRIEVEPDRESSDAMYAGRH
ncbi:MAG: nuclear transport factor 2 family protein [Rhizobiales bacterium]|nr:nuclear transport factor 2 family protein [Hyphomicrobiales bacterium]